MFTMRDFLARGIQLIKAERGGEILLLERVIALAGVKVHTHHQERYRVLHLLVNLFASKVGIALGHSQYRER